MPSFLVTVTVAVICAIVANLVNYSMKRIQQAQNIKNSPNLDFVFDSDSSEVPTCSICLNRMRSNHIKQLHCGHIFHRHCLAQWLGYNQTNCPTCGT